MYKVNLFTDGACKTAERKGGYAGIMQCAGKEHIEQGNSDDATNNSMELKAVVASIRVLTKPCEVTVYTDSTYVCTGIANYEEWAKNKWVLKNKKTPKNLALWQEFYEIVTRMGHVVRFQYIKGHSGHPMNERCDQMAKHQIQLLEGGD